MAIRSPETCQLSNRSMGMRIATPVCGLARNDIQQSTILNPDRQHHVGKVVLVIGGGQDDGA